MKKVDLIGRRFGKLVVQELTSGCRSGSKLWRCLCDCGNEKFVTTRHLNRNPKNSTVVRSCGCLNNNQKLGNNNPYFKGVGKISATYFNRHITKSSKKRSKNGSDIEVGVDIKYINNLFEKQGGLCAYTQDELTLPTKWDDRDYTASIDRVDSSKGYVEGNIQFVHRHINIMKNVFSEPYFIEMCKKVSNNNLT